MKEFNMAGLRESLEQLPTDRLDAMLQTELQKEPLNEHAVRLILGILREREADYPVEHNEQIDRAWEKYQQKTSPKKPVWGTMLLRVASVLVIVGTLVFALPREVNARNFFDRIAAWTDSIFELFSPSDSSQAQDEYIFRTDHPGLQELYDTVTGLGVTVPVVPMWLDESYVLKNCKVMETPGVSCLTANFISGKKEFVFELTVYNQNTSSIFHKDEPDALKYEIDGTTFNIIRNEGIWMHLLACTSCKYSQKSSLWT